LVHEVIFRTDPFIVLYIAKSVSSITAIELIIVESLTVMN